VGWKLTLPGGGGGIKIVINTPGAGGAPTTTPLDRDAFEAEIVRLVNEERITAGLSPLEVDPGLMQFARERSEDMVAREYYSHNDPVTGEDLTPNIGENLLKNRAGHLSLTIAQGSIATWMRSEGHQNNILAGHSTKTGVGVAIGNGYIIVTQLFAH